MERVRRHYAARRPTGCDIAIADRIGMLDARAWDVVTAGGSFFQSRAYLAMLEAAGPANIRPRYALVGDAGNPLAALTMQVVDVSGERLLKSESRLQEKLAGRMQLRILVCGNLLTYGQHGVAFGAGADRARLWSAAGEVLYRIRRAEKLVGAMDFILAKDFTPTDREGIAALEALSYRAVETDPNMVLALASTWRSHADYLASLASKYRSAVKTQILKPIEAAGLTIERIRPDEGEAGALHELYLQVQANAAVRPVTLPPAYFPALAAAAGERLRCTVIRDAAHMLGFMITLLDGDTAVTCHVGFDRRTELPLYLRLLHLAIEDSIALGAKRVSFGRTALEPKARLGARPEAMSVWVRHRQPVLNRMLKSVLGLVSHEEAPDRNPFKHGAGE